MGVRANYQDIVMLSVIGEVASPRLEGNGYTIGHDGAPRVLTTSGGITYNVRVGDRAIGWAADHTEPGVTVRNKDPQEHVALTALAGIAHADSVAAGHGPGVDTVLASASGAIRPRLAPDEANISWLLGLRPARAAAPGGD